MLKLHLNKPKFQLLCVLFGYLAAGVYSDFRSTSLNRLGCHF